MTLSLYDMTVPTYLQILGGLRGVLAKGLEHAKNTRVDPQTLVEARLTSDMLALDFQIRSVVNHSLGALRDVSKGSYTMPTNGTFDYAGLQRLIVEAETALKGFTPQAVNAQEGKALNFDFGSYKATFTAEDYLLSFALPNFYFHAVTAYGILRMKGVPIGKGDYVGQVRMKFG